MPENSSLLPQPFAARDLQTLQSLTQAGMNLVSITISPLSRSAGVAVPQLDLPRACVLVVLVRGQELIYPRGDTTLAAWDQVFAVVDQHSEEHLRQTLTRLAGEEAPC